MTMEMTMLAWCVFFHIIVVTIEVHIDCKIGHLVETHLLQVVCDGSIVARYIIFGLVRL